MADNADVAPHYYSSGNIGYLFVGKNSVFLVKKS